MPQHKVIVRVFSGSYTRLVRPSLFLNLTLHTFGELSDHLRLRQKIIMPEFAISHLDHVAIFAADPAASVKWYEEVLGLHKVQLEEWGEFPIFMLAGQVGVAIFNASTEAKPQDTRRGSVGIDHFAFNLTTDNFALARTHYKALGLSFHFQDHHYFHSLYTKDPDGNTVELTTAVKTIPFKGTF